MELKSTVFGQRLAQHPYNRVVLLNAGIEVSGDKHRYLIPFNQLIAVRCRRGIVWGELEFELPDATVVRLHGTEWQETQHFYQVMQRQWQAWGEEMSVISAQVLQQQVAQLHVLEQQDLWLKQAVLAQVQQAIGETFDALPLPVQRLNEFELCRTHYAACLRWLEQGAQSLRQRNQQWAEHIQLTHRDFFQSIAPIILNDSQYSALLNNDDRVLILGGPGTGKTTLLIGRAMWLLWRQEAQATEILLLSFNRCGVEQTNRFLEEQGEVLQAHTFHTLASAIIEQSGAKVPLISQLEGNSHARRRFFITHWQQQCSEKKAQAKGWRQWLTEELGWSVSDDDFWHDEHIVTRLAERLDRWMGLLRMAGGSQVEMMASAPEALQGLFQQRIRLLAPLLKAWKSAIKAEGAVDFPSLIQQALNRIQKGRFISPWRHILVDEFQDLPLPAMTLLAMLQQQNKHTQIVAAGDDCQSIYRFNEAQPRLTTTFSRWFSASEGREENNIEHCLLKTSYRVNQSIREIAKRFIQQNPGQLPTAFVSSLSGDKQAVRLLPEDQLAVLLDKLSGYVKKEQRVLILARYNHLRPSLLEKAATRWPGLSVDFATFHTSQGQQADYVIILGLHQGEEGFPAPARESVIDEVLLPDVEDFPHAQERRLLYVAMTRARHQVWLLYSQQSPSLFVNELIECGVAKQRKP